ncbi:MAG: polysaccharide biosynthesis protein [Bacteroidales bacterium]|nr:polysaccharide biosynthesis protein [Bacteroidales bacterium]
MKQPSANPLKHWSFNLVRRYRHSTIPRWAIMFMDVTLFVIAYVLMKILVLYTEPLVSTSGELVEFLTAAVLTVLFFLATGTHRAIIRHVGMSDILKIIIATVGPMIVFWAVNFINGKLEFIDNRYLLSYRESFQLYTMLAMFMILSRIFVQRVYDNYFKRRRQERNIVIYGAGAAGIITVNALNQDLHYEYKVVAFIDDDMSKVNQELNGVPVMRARAVLTPKFIEQKKIEEIIIAIPTIRNIHKQAITNKALDLGLTVKSVPHISHWINGTFSVGQIEKIKIEDLLERESIKLDNVNIVREVADKVVLVTGAAGSIGSEICRQLFQYQPAKVIMLDQAESPMYDLQFELRSTKPYCDSVDRMEFVIANVKDYQRMEEVFERFHPQLIYHAAAYKHVPFMEENPYEAVYVNVFGTRNVADLAIKYGAQKFVMVSTDKAVNPTNVMGATKRMAEIYIQSRSTDRTHFVTTRFGNVLGSNGSVIPLFKKQLAAGGPLTVTHRDIIRYFMTIPEACNLVLEAGAMGQGGDIFVFDMGKPVKIYDMARKMIQLSGMPNIEIKEIGLRPGEKLYEELLANKEANIPTHHPKIMRAQVRTYPLEAIDREYNELWDILETMKPMDIVAKMKSIVPEFISNNSVYCQLDHSTAPQNTENQ